MKKFQRHAARAVLGAMFGVCMLVMPADADDTTYDAAAAAAAAGASSVTNMSMSDVCNQPGVKCVVDSKGFTRLTLVDPAEKIMADIPGAQAMWKQCYDDCRQHQECNPGMCSSHCVGEVMAITKSTQEISDMMKYNVMAAAGAMCIGKMIDYIKKIQQAITSINSGDPLEAIANALIDTIADQIMTQILNSLTNEICAVTSQLLNYADSVIKNAICLPVGSIGNPFDFHLNLKDMQCNGLSVDLLTGQTNGSLINGVSMPSTNVYGTGLSSGTSTPVNNTTVSVPTIDPITVPQVTEPLTTIPNVDPTTLSTGTSSGSGSTGGTAGQQ